MSRWYIKLGLGLFVGVYLAPYVLAQDAPSDAKLKSLQREIDAEKARTRELEKAAETVAAEAEDLSRKAIAAAAHTQELEQEATQIEKEVADLSQREQEGVHRLMLRRRQSSEVAAAMQSLARRPPEALIAMPGRPIDSLRSALLLRSAIPAIEAEATRLKSEVAQLKQLRTDAEERRISLATANTALLEERATIEGLLARKRDLYRDAQASSHTSAEKVTALLAKAADMRDLLARLKAEREKQRQAEIAAAAAVKLPPAPNITGPKAVTPSPTAAPVLPRDSKPAGIRDVPKQPGSLILPARGEMVRRFGETDGYGVASKGLIIATRPGAQIVAPFDGQVAFSGQFRGFGLILIIEHSGGYHSLLAGLGRADAGIGQWVLAGEPVAVMGDGDTGKAPELYIEWRRDGEPLNPLPWMMVGNDKVNG
ncbi:MAG: peptidoglycan DD-metalloendopeptidase family protein [Alphaproteobacteria bacterium]